MTSKRKLSHRFGAGAYESMKSTSKVSRRRKHRLRNQFWSGKWAELCSEGPTCWAKQHTFCTSRCANCKDVGRPFESSGFKHSNANTISWDAKGAISQVALQGDLYTRSSLTLFDQRRGGGGGARRAGGGTTGACCCWGGRLGWGCW